VEPVRGLLAALLPGEEGNRRVRCDCRHRRRERLELALLPALDAVDDDEPPTKRERHRVQGGRHRLGGCGVALEQLDPVGAALGLGHRAQVRAPLGYAAVVVAVDQVCGLERGHLLISERRR
jgi:hypothetical protein